MVIPISTQTDLKPKSLTTNKEKTLLIKGSIHQEEIIIKHVYQTTEVQNI